MSGDRWEDDLEHGHPLAYVALVASLLLALVLIGWLLMGLAS